MPPPMVQASEAGPSRVHHTQYPAISLHSLRISELLSPLPEPNSLLPPPYPLEVMQFQAEQASDDRRYSAGELSVTHIENSLGESNQLSGELLI